MPPYPNTTATGVARHIFGIVVLLSLTLNDYYPAAAATSVLAHRAAPLAFVPTPRRRPTVPRKSPSYSRDVGVRDGADPGDKVEPDAGVAHSKDEDAEKIGNLVADDEWMGLSMELSELVRVAVIEDVKRQTRDFIGKENYKVGDVAKEIDRRVKDEVARMREKDEYELGDLSAALDEMAKEATCDLTGKDDYEFGDLSKEIDNRVKNTVAEYCGKDTYEFGDLTKEITRRTEERVLEFTNKEDYEFGDISKEIESRRRKWVSDFLGDEAAENYQFGDITKKAVSNFTGKDDYEFGDITKKVLGNVFGKRKHGGKDK